MQELQRIRPKGIMVLADGRVYAKDGNRRVRIRSEHELGTMAWLVDYQAAMEARPSNDTLGQYMDTWLDSVTEGLAAETSESYRGLFIKVREAFGERRLDWLTSEEGAQEFEAWRDTISGDRSADQMAQLMTRFATWMRRKRHIKQDHSFLDFPRRYQRGDHSEDVWLPHEQEQMLTALNPEMRPLFQAALYTGARRTDLVALTWEHRVKPGLFRWPTSKSRGRSSQRAVLRPEAVQFFDKLHAEHPTGEGYIFLSRYRGRVLAPYTPDSVSRAVAKAARKVGVRKRLHDCRGTYCCEMVQALLKSESRTPNQVKDLLADLMGWKRGEVDRLLRIYATAEAVDAMYEGLFDT